MDEFALARAIHVVAVVAWIGGVYLVTMVVLPAVRASASTSDKFAYFEDIESRFGVQARIITLIAGASGFYMLYLLDGWSRYASWDYWWVHAMTCIWLLFTVVLFVLEPLFLHAWFTRKMAEAPERTLSVVTQFHRILLAASLVTVFGAVIGVHG